MIAAIIGRRIALGMGQVSTGRFAFGHARNLAIAAGLCKGDGWENIPFVSYRKRHEDHEISNFTRIFIQEYNKRFNSRDYTALKSSGGIMRNFRRHSAFAIVAAGILASAPAQAEDTVPPFTSMPSMALLQGMSNFREAYLDQLLSPLRAATDRGQALTEDDIANARRLALASRRAQMLMPFLASDLDGDGQVTLQEYQAAQRRGRRTPSAAENDQVAKQFQQMDGNGDGIVTYEEARASAVRALEAGNGRSYGDDRLANLLALDPNKDGKLTPGELEALGRAAFAYYDRDGDGILSDDERKALSADIEASRQQAMFRDEFARCIMQPPTGDEQVYYIDISRPQALSSASLVGQDNLTETAEINIEPGSTPLYVLALARVPTIWRFTGDVKRVTHFVAASGVPVIGVAGLPNSVVTLPRGVRCRRSMIPGNPASARQAAAALAQATGRPVAGMVYKPFFKASLPSGATAPAEIADTSPAGAPDVPAAIPAAPAGVDADVNAAFWRNHPGGLVQIDPAAVIATAPAASYDVPPMEAGLMKFLADGSISKDGPHSYLINRQITRLPAGLSHENAVSMRPAPGLKPPVDDPDWAPVLLPKGAFRLPRAPAVKN